MMCLGVHLCRLVALVLLFRMAASTVDPSDLAALKSLKSIWENVPPNWDSGDPCGNNWDGISCSNDRITSITLGSIGLSGQLSSDITGLSELQILDLSYNNEMKGPLPPSIGDLKSLSSLILVGCGFTGEIPPSIGSLTNLLYLSLNKNKFSGPIPPSFGLLLNLRWLDIADNELSGSIPVSSDTTPGLDMLVNTRHFHFGNNRLTGVIPPQLFSSNMILIHLLLENNQLTDIIPSSLGLVQTLEVVRLDRNRLSGTVPGNLNNLTIQSLYLSNNEFTGPFPNLTGMNSLNYVDFSNNSFDATDVPSSFSSLESLTSLIMESTNIKGQLPVSLFSLSQLQTVVFKNNRINGTLDIGSRYSDQLHLIDLENNLVDDFPQRQSYKVNNIILVRNPICNEGNTQMEKYCSLAQQPNSTYATPSQNCSPTQCDSDKTSSPTCKCLYPYSGYLYFRAPSFSDFGNETIFESLKQEMMGLFTSHGQPVDSVSVSNPTRDKDHYLVLSLQIFPSGQDYFNRSGISGIAFMLSNQTFKPPHYFGPFYFNGNKYPYFAGLAEGKRKSNTGLIIGASVGGSVLVLLLAAAGVYAFRQKRLVATASRRGDPFASWDTSSNSGGVPQLKGARCFSFEEMKKCTNNFSETNNIGSGGYGKVYRGTLPGRQLVAIKRAQHGSTQGGLEFKTEIELLSRVHHKNVVSLVGFCFDQGEQMLVYEYITNGTLKESLNGKSGIRLDWMRRLRIALGAARGVHYLHEQANPPIIHRDIKSNNILLDDRLNAKVADFGLSKPMVDTERSHVTTQVKGTMGYLDPEYYMTQQLTEKSDVYSFGVLLLEILTSTAPIVKGKYIVREVKEVMDKSKPLYNLDPLLDPIVASNMSPGSVERFVELTLRCVQELGDKRPTMGEVVKEIESIMEMAGLNPNAESASTSDTYEGVSKGSANPYSNESIFTNSGGYDPTKIDTN
ncbi:hypothetical protein ACS0TY_002975 [Phlomoides rotata]